MRRAAPWIVLALALAFPLAMQAGHQSYYLSFASRIFVYALAATSLNLILGYGGMISFGHAAFVGTGAYVSSILLAEGVASAWIGWPAAVAASAVAALAIGAVSLRTRGVYFIMITLAFAQMAFFLVNSMKAYGGDEGLNLPARASIGFGADLGNDLVFYYTALAALAAALVGLHRLAHSRFGRVIQAIRENEARAEAIGFPVYRYKLACFVIAGAAGGLAGALLASHGKYVNPNVLHWTQSGTLMVMVILGGVGQLWGGVIGAAALLGLEDLIANHRVEWLAAMLPNYQQHASLGVGVVLLAIVLFAPQGIAGLFAGGGVLELKNVSKHFGGVVATDDVAFDVKRGEVHALIGPNGAGKTTLVAQIAGDLASDGGSIVFEGTDVTHAPQHDRVRAGLARSYQITSIFKRLTVLDNLALAVQARSGSSFSFWRPVAAEAGLFDEARAIAGEVGLSGREAAVAANLAHGEQRALEVGLALATRPRLVLLDEPMAGMGPEESQSMIALVERIRARVSVLLVEHDMDAVFRLADRISVLVQGRLIATGVPEAIRADAKVRKAYLGEDATA